MSHSHPYDAIEDLRKAFPHGHPEFVELLGKAAKLHSDKNYDYARGSDPLGNFKRVAAILAAYWPVPFGQEIGPAVVAFIYALKQVDATAWQFSQGGENLCEGAEPRQFDRAVYALLEIILTKEGKQ